MAKAHRRFLGKPVVSVTSKASAYSFSSAGLENWDGCKGVGRKDMGFYLCLERGLADSAIKDQRVNSLGLWVPDLCHNYSSLPL